MLGPFPDRGEYEHCHTFELSGPEDANLDKLVQMIEASRKISFRDTREWHQKDAEREKKETQATAEDMIRNRLPAFGGRALASSHVRRSFKTAPLLLTAQQAGLPTKPGLQTLPKRAA